MIQMRRINMSMLFKFGNVFDEGGGSRQIVQAVNDKW